MSSIHRSRSRKAPEISPIPMWVLVGIIAIIAIAVWNHQEDNPSARETQVIEIKLDWTCPVEVKIVEGRSEWDALNRAGWPEEKITWAVVEEVQKHPLNARLYAGDRCLRAGDKLHLPRYIEELKD